jgi:hypothetical protein
LQKGCGDDPNKLLMERTPIFQILDQYGQLTRKHQRLIVSSDWLEADFFPRPDGIRLVHKLKWGDIGTLFIQEYSNKVEWKDVLEILKKNKHSQNSKTSNKAFDEIVEKLYSWTPNRKRALEEGYKIELRNYLSEYFNLEEEVGVTPTC